MYSELFLKILIEEEDARLNDDDKIENMESYMEAPKFGKSTAEDQDVLRFYNYWDNFVSAKEFAWADEYKTSKDHDRRINRLIDQDNKKARVKEKKKYTDTVR